METYLRKSYTTFLQKLGVKLKMPRLTIATAIVLCHRFLLRQCHTQNDRITIATVCMFFAGKSEDTPRPLRDVIVFSYEISNKRNPGDHDRIRQKAVYQNQKQLVLQGESLLLETLGFDLNIDLPYDPLRKTLEQLNLADNARLAEVSWNFVNDSLRTSLSLQFKAGDIAAGAFFLASMFLKLKLPSLWWQKFNVIPQQLEDMSHQMLDMYEAEHGSCINCANAEENRRKRNLDIDVNDGQLCCQGRYQKRAKHGHEK